MQTYARHGGTSTIFINDDGLRVRGLIFIKLPADKLNAGSYCQITNAMNVLLFMQLTVSVG